MPKSINIQNSKLTFTNSEESSLNFFNLTLDSNYITLPRGNTAQRPSVAEAGMIRFNTSTNFIEGYNGFDWVTVQLA